MGVWRHCARVASRYGWGWWPRPWCWWPAVCSPPGIAVTSIMRHSLINRVDETLLDASRGWAQAPRRMPTTADRGTQPRTAAVELLRARHRLRTAASGWRSTTARPSPRCPTATTSDPCPSPWGRSTTRHVQWRAMTRARAARRTDHRRHRPVRRVVDRARADVVPGRHRRARCCWCSASPGYCGGAPQPAPAGRSGADRGRDRRRRARSPCPATGLAHRSRSIVVGAQRNARADPARRRGVGGVGRARPAPPRTGCGASSPTPATSCAPRSPRSVASPSCTARAPRATSSC